MLSNTEFMVKFNFFEKQNIPQYSIVKIVTIINDVCLIEDIKTLNRVWVMKYDIYPLNNNNLNGYWEYSNIYNEIAIKQNLKK